MCAAYFGQYFRISRIIDFLDFNLQIHKRCSGVCGDFSRVADGFRCRRCDGTIQEVDLAEDLMVDGETYACVKSFCYLGDTLDRDGGADLAATARIRNGWMKFRELLPFLTSRARWR